MKKIWVNAAPWNKKIVMTALESGADAVLVPKGCSSKVKELGLIKTISIDGDLRLGQDVICFKIKNKKDEEEAVKLSKSKILIIQTTDWRIIPLENLIAQTKGLIVEVKNCKEAKTAVQILETGVSGVLINTSNLSEIKKTIEFIKSASEILKLEVAKITKVQPLGMGDRVCIDTCTNMKRGQGMLIGNTSKALFLVHSESIENPYVSQRPFRVNAGAVHAYALVNERKTKYLSEMSSGDKILIADNKGKTIEAIVGRSKTEKRPMMLIKAAYQNEEISIILQNAETVRLTDPKGEPISVVNLNKKSKVLVYIGKGGRHFGNEIDESIIEK